MEEEILELAMTLGGTGEGERERLRALCAGASRELEGRLREGVSREDCHADFALAAAWTALADLAAGCGNDGVESFTAGALTIRMGERGNGAELRRRALIQLTPWLRDEGFSFRGVPG